MTRRAPRAQSSVGNRRRHWEVRREQNAALGAKGVAYAWSDQARATATTQARRGDHSGWSNLVVTLQTFCSRFPAADTRRAANQTYHWERRLAVLEGASPKAVALAWWDRARVVAGDQDDDAGWNDLAMTLSNYCQHYKA
ncbi:hypothetical protein [Nonomuraea zeae]|uniref:Uncharacterized protein n=1 Tax=Nonomuraea zeae TaxID=1642303 RepID=A0A5S4H3R7_9ACTN|nr:hypothetical protein [Nonomuraea zeae]TMR39582.1 hypothetical protein ETD85_00790 [Nonomuraea zeae]